MEVQVKKLDERATLPKYAHDDDAGMDFFSLEDVSIAPGERQAVATGIALAIPEGYVGLFWDKSGVSVKAGLTTMAGVVDAGYRGELKIVLLNTSDTTQTFAAGDKVAQMLIQSIEHPQLVVVDELEDTARDEGGFGSTGT